MNISIFINCNFIYGNFLQIIVALCRQSLKRNVYRTIQENIQNITYNDEYKMKEETT